MPTAYYLTQMQIRTDPETPVVQWCLSDEGRAQALRVARQPWVARIGRIVSTDERPALETAQPFGQRRRRTVEVNPMLGDSRRPRSEYLSLSVLDEALAAFFAMPDASARPGWETARDAQRRIAAAVDGELAATSGPRDILFVGHPRAGTLLRCHLLGTEISRQHFPRAVNGNLFSFDTKTGKVLSDWLHTIAVAEDEP